MQDVHIFGEEHVAPDLARLESEFPNIFKDFGHVLALLHGRPFSFGQRLDPSDSDLHDVSWGNVYHNGRDGREYGAAVLIFEAWRDVNGIFIQLLGVIPGAKWKRLSADGQREEARKLVSPA